MNEIISENIVDKEKMPMPFFDKTYWSVRPTSHIWLCLGQLGGDVFLESQLRFGVFPKIRSKAVYRRYSSHRISSHGNSGASQNYSRLSRRNGEDISYKVINCTWLTRIANGNGFLISYSFISIVRNGQCSNSAIIHWRSDNVTTVEAHLTFPANVIVWQLWKYKFPSLVLQ